MANRKPPLQRLKKCTDPRNCAAGENHKVVNVYMAVVWLFVCPFSCPQAFNLREQNHRKNIVEDSKFSLVG